MVLKKLGVPLEWTELADRKPGPGEIQLKVAACGVCRTDLHVVDGELPDPKLPIIPGHEVVGRIDGIGAGVEALRVGERVGVPWLGHTCGVCPYCRGGRENLCDRPLFTGYTRDARDVLTKQQQNMAEKIPVMRRMCAIARELRDVLTTGRDLNVFGTLLHEAWEAKRSLNSAISNSLIDEYYERGIRAGALGGKLLGAGGGGFLLFFCEPHNQNRLRAELAELRELQFALDPQGSKIVYVAD